MGTDGLELFAVRDTKSNGEGQVGVAADARNKVGKLNIDCGGGTSDTKLGNNVDETVGNLGQMTNAFVRCRWGNQRNV